MSVGVGAGQYVCRVQVQVSMSVGVGAGKYVCMV